MAMTATIHWYPVATRLTYSPVGFRLIDDITGREPIGAITCSVLIQDASSQWHPTDLQPVRSASGILIFPGLGRASFPATTQPRSYRAVLAAEFYRPYYAAQQDGLDFKDIPYNDDQPIQNPVGISQDVVLVPATNYPFPAYVRVLRGIVRDASGKPVSNVEVHRGNNERVLSDERGAYALPLRLDPNNTPIPIDAVDHRTARTGQITVTLPADLAKNQVITLN
jgi:hypothetical protein